MYFAFQTYWQSKPCHFEKKASQGSKSHSRHMAVGISDRIGCRYNSSKYHTPRGGHKTGTQDKLDVFLV